MCFRRGSIVSYVHRHLQIVYSLTDWRLFHVNAYTCISHVFKLKIKIISDRELLKITMDIGVINIIHDIRVRT